MAMRLISRFHSKDEVITSFFLSSAYLIALPCTAGDALSLIATNNVVQFRDGTGVVKCKKSSLKTETLRCAH